MFFSVGSFGFFGYGFIDLNHYRYLQSSQTDNKGDEESGKEKEIKEDKFKSLADLTSLCYGDILKGFGKRMSQAAQIYAALLVVLQWLDLSNSPTLSQLYEIRNRMVSSTVLQDDLLESISRSIGVQFCPVTAILGGLFGQEIIKGISGQDRPIGNVLIYDTRWTSSPKSSLSGSAVAMTL